ncbi:hypothetical protein MMC13_007421 [Lambiella insularis]|nr:hypothetical protein [Lambiella insularis]
MAHSTGTRSQYGNSPTTWPDDYHYIRDDLSRSRTRAAGGNIIGVTLAWYNVAVRFCRTAGTVTRRRADRLEADLAQMAIRRNQLAVLAEGYRLQRNLAREERDAAREERDAAEASGRMLQERLEEAQREWRIRISQVEQVHGEGGEGGQEGEEGGTKGTKGTKGTEEGDQGGPSGIRG